MMLPRDEVAQALGGKVKYGRTEPHVVAPGPGQKSSDRSLSVWNNGGEGLASTATGGIIGAF